MKNENSRSLCVMQYRFNCSRIIFFVLLVNLALQAAWAESVVDSSIEIIRWSQLTDQQRKVLVRAESRWDALSPAKRARLVKRADKFIAMKPEQRQRFVRRVERWRSLPAVKRKAMLREYRHFRSLPKAKRQALKKRYQQFQSLPPQRKQQLREKWQQRRQKIIQREELLQSSDFSMPNRTVDRDVRSVDPNRGSDTVAPDNPPESVDQIRN